MFHLPLDHPADRVTTMFPDRPSIATLLTWTQFLRLAI
jgi:hypothetical protein